MACKVNITNWPVKTIMDVFWLDELKRCAACEARKGGKFSCRRYNSRPEFCRDFPRHPLDLVEFNRCTYRFVIEEPGEGKP